MVRNFWDPCSANLVSQNSQIFNFQGFRHSWKVTSSPSGSWTSKWVLGCPPKAKGCRSGGPRRKHILKNDPQNKYFLGNWETLNIRENCYFCYAFLWFLFLLPPPPPPHFDSDFHPCIRLCDGPAILRRVRLC